MSSKYPRPMYSIYRLINPKTNEVFYIGSTSDIILRAGGHGKKADTAYGLTPKDRYIRDNDICAIMEVVEVVEADMSKLHRKFPVNVLLVETKWIEYYLSIGAPMQNSRWYNKKKAIQMVIV